MTDTSRDQTFQWEGALPLLDLAGEDAPGPEVRVKINLAAGLEIPEVRANDPLPEVGHVLDLEVAGVSAQLYRYVVVPRGLRAFYTDRLQLGTFGLFLRREASVYLFLLPGDQPDLAKDEVLRLRQELRDLQEGYERRDPDALRETALVRGVEGFFSASGALHEERRLFVAEIAAEVEGEVHFLHRSSQDGARSLQGKLPARPGQTVGLALRLEGITRRLHADHLEESRGKGVRGKTAKLHVPGEERPRTRRSKTDAEGWASFDDVELVSERRLELEVAGIDAVLNLRWGREEEPALDLPSPPLGAISTALPLPRARERLLQDLHRCWDPDVGCLREVAAGQTLPFDLEHLEVALELEDEEPVFGRFLEEARRRLAPRRREPLKNPVAAYLLGVAGPRKVLRPLREAFETHEREAPGLWTEEYALLVQGLAAAVRSRPTKGLRELAADATLGLATRLEVEPEPTWRYRALRRPVKTFRANPDVALPHAQAIVALSRARAALELPDWVGEVATAQGVHLLEFHPVDGEPPSYVLGSWKDRARLETPTRMGLALDVLARAARDERLLGREERLRRLVWQRFLMHYSTVEIRERMILLRWLGEAEWALGEPLPPRAGR